MSSLIKNEITKIFKKKSIYVMLLVILGFTLLVCFMQKYGNRMMVYGEYYSEGYIKTLEEEIKNLNPENIEEVDQYVDYKTDIETYYLLKKYDTNSWQYDVASNYARNYISDVNYNTYKIKNNEDIESAKSRYSEFTERLNSGNWKKFAEEELKEAKNMLEYNQEDTMSKIQVETLQMRLDYNIEYGNNYKNNALNRYSASKMQVLEYEQSNENKTYNDKKSYQEAKGDMEKSKYVIENDKDIFNNENLRGMLLNMFPQYELFIIITVALIAGAIVSEEFSKGTIKLLLVRPYSRAKILLAKYIVVLLTILFVIIALGITQFIVGGIFFGFSSLSTEVVEYNFNTNKLVEMNVLQSVILTCIGKLPIYILLGTLGFAISAIFTNTAVAITLLILGYMASSIINQFALYYNVSWLKYFVTPNWDLTQFFYGKLPDMQGINMLFAVIICLIYFLIMMIPTFIVFRKKNIKNI